MRLKFNILCFEDDHDFAVQTLESLEIYLEEQGFYLNTVDICKDSEKLEEIVQKVNEKKLDVDLILMDYKLANNVKGNKLIENIRSHKLLTDIIFYSQHPDFRKNIGLLDGVYSVDRGFLRDKLIAVTDHILKKALDLSSLRGLVMAETSELDDLIIKIILTFLERDFFSTPIKMKESIKKKVQNSFKDRLKKLDRIEINSPVDTHKLISELEASHKGRTLMELIENFKKEQGENVNVSKYLEIKTKLDNNPFVFNDYEQKIMKFRNMFAHGKETRNEKGEKIVKSTRPGSEDFVFDESKTVKLRQDLKKYYEILTGIYEAVSGEKWD
jgi:CheY-like chemotaxis protein